MVPVPLGLGLYRDPPFGNFVGPFFRSFLMWFYVLFFVFVHEVFRAQHEAILGPTLVQVGPTWRALGSNFGPSCAKLVPRSDFSEILWLFYMLFNIVMFLGWIFEEFSMISWILATLKMVLPCTLCTDFKDVGLPRWEMIFVGFFGANMASKI